MAPEPDREEHLDKAIDLASVVRNGTYDISIATQESVEDAYHRRWKDRLIFLLGLAGLTIVFMTCLGVLVFGSQTAEEKKIWAGVLSTLVGGMVGYALKK